MGQQDTWHRVWGGEEQTAWHISVTGSDGRCHFCPHTVAVPELNLFVGVISWAPSPLPCSSPCGDVTPTHWLPGTSPVLGAPRQGSWQGHLTQPIT